MFTPIAIVSALASVAWAQSSNSYIPKDITESCTKFLTSFNQDTSLSGCTSSLISATSSFAPGSTATSASIPSALDTICASNACPESTIRASLAEFYEQCTEELTSKPNKEVILLYDIIYTIPPLKTALCTKDDDKSYCVVKTAPKLTSAGLNAETVQKGLVESQTPLKINAATYGSSNLLFLFLQPTLPQAELCVPCTRNILASFIAWESTISYGPGLVQSQLLVNQAPVYEAIVKTCGQSFLSGSVAAAGGISNKWGSNSAAMSADAQGVISTVLGALTVAFLSAL